MTSLTTHVELKNMMPPLSEAEYAGLEADILERGCLSPIVVWGNVIVDGHNRYIICQAHELPFETRSLDFDSLEEAKFWAWSHQEHRRNLTPYQRTQMALQFKPMLSAKGREKMAFSARNKGRENYTDSLPEQNTRQEIAKLANVSENTVSRVEFLEQHADDDTRQRLANGETSINREYTRLKAAESEYRPEPYEPTCPNQGEGFKRRVNLQHILLEDTESLVTCLFSIFDASYREQLIYDVLEKARERDGQDTVRRIVGTLSERFC